MTAEEAIKTIRVAIADVKWNYLLDYSVAFKTAIEALEKQIPKKPIFESEQTSPFGVDDVPYCPNCRCDLPEVSYCEKCGQALDWSDNNGVIL